MPPDNCKTDVRTDIRNSILGNGFGTGMMGTELNKGKGCLVQEEAE
jgi:hypothetical protein